MLASSRSASAESNAVATVVEALALTVAAGRARNATRPRAAWCPLLLREPPQGGIENPGYEKMLAIARAMGCPPALWFEDAPGDGAPTATVEGQDLAGRIAHLYPG
jgi:hypothetical protein